MTTFFVVFHLVDVYLGGATGQVQASLAALAGHFTYRLCLYRPDRERLSVLDAGRDIDNNHPSLLNRVT